MARIADEVIERIKAEVSLVRLAEGQGYQLHKQGKDVALCCPFHEDKTPSCIITPKSNLFNCFGCGAGGSVIDWVMKTQGVSFRHAVELLKNDIGAVTSSLAAESPIKKTTVPKLAAPVSSNADDAKLLREVVDYYHETLLQSPEAIAYLESRGLNDPELINHFKLGHANRTLGLRLPHKNRKAGAELREKLQHVGVYRESGHEHLNGSLVIPLLNKSGDVVQLYGRKLLNNLREGTAYHLYLPGDHAGVFNYADLVGCEEIILCEALIDALTFWRWGFKNVTSSYGVNGFTDELLQTLVELKIKRVLIAYDRDDAGNVAAEKLAKQLNGHGIDAFRLLFPKGMDANEYVDQMVPAPKALALVIRSAQWLGSGRAPQVTTQLLHEGDTEKCPTVGQQVMSLDSKMEQPSASAISSLAVDVLASPVPPLPPAQLVLETRNDGLYAQLGEGAQARMYRVRGLEQNSGAEQLKIQLYVQRGEAFFIDKLDLYSSKQRQIFINQACVELGVSDEIIKKDLGKVLLGLEQEQLKKSDENKNPSSASQSLTNEEREAALALLRDKDLPARILADFALAGVVGEETNKLVGYLAGVSRKLDRPLAVVIQSSSAAGKSSLMDAVLSFMPEDERVQYSAMTGQSLFYMGETRLKNKILAISEEEGAHTASYALKLLQSEGEVTIASTGKDDSSGQLVTREYKVEGPVMLFLTTTAIDIDEELLNRCLVLTVNESREQTEAIHHAQRLKRTLKGLEAKIKKEQVLQLHRNAQRLLKPLAVINPYADQLTFLSDKTRTRRDHEKYLTLIDSIALLHQYQREIKTLGALDYIEVTTADIALANRLAHEVLGKTLDELPPQTRKLLKEIQLWVQQCCKVDGIAQRDFRFSRRHVRELCGWSETQVRVHLQRLVSMEYVLVHRGSRGQSFDYELLYQGEGEQANHFIMGLVDADKLINNRACSNAESENVDTTKSSRGEVDGFAVPTRPQRGAIADAQNEVKASNGAAFPELQNDWVENANLAV
jgi:DNA primase